MTASAHSAVVILAHTDPPQVQRLCRAMSGSDVFLHCDLNTPDTVYEQIATGAPGHVQMLPRLRTTRSSWSLVNAELQGLQIALERSSAEHIVVMSGSCYPLLGADELEAELISIRGRSRLQVAALPHSGWNTRRNQDGGYWRFRRRFVVRHDQTLHFRGIPLRTRRRRIPHELVLHAGSQWKVYARSHARQLLTICDERPDLVRFFRHSFIPDESFAPTILKSPELVGSTVDEVVNGSLWYIEWSPEDPGHPRWLDRASFDGIRRARGASPPHSCASDQSADAERCWFARKVRSTESELLDRIDAELRR